MIIFVENNPVPVLRHNNRQDVLAWLTPKEFFISHDGAYCAHPVVWYHGGGFKYANGKGHLWFTDSPLIAKTYREAMIQKCYLKSEAGKLKKYDFNGANWHGIKWVDGHEEHLSFGVKPGELFTDGLVKQSFAKGFDTVVFQNVTEDLGHQEVKAPKNYTGKVSSNGYVDDLHKISQTECIVKSSKQLFWFA